MRHYPSSVTQKRLSTVEAVKYLNSTREDYTNNQIGIKLYDYQSLQYAIELKKHGAGVMKSYQFNEMVGKVDKDM